MIFLDSVEHFKFCPAAFNDCIIFELGIVSEQLIVQKLFKLHFVQFEIFKVISDPVVLMDESQSDQ